MKTFSQEEVDSILKEIDDMCGGGTSVEKDNYNQLLVYSDEYPDERIGDEYGVGDIEDSYGCVIYTDIFVWSDGTYRSEAEENI